MANAKVRVLVVDDSALVRNVLVRGLSDDPAIQVIGMARDPYEAREILVHQKPDVITLDVEMPRMDGLTFLRHYMRVIPTPTIVVSAHTAQGAQTTVEALEAGAVDFVTKPGSGSRADLSLLLAELRAKVKGAANACLRRPHVAPTTPGEPAAATQQALQSCADKVIAIGCSAGGTEALARLLPRMPAATPGIVIVQHMPATFTASLAKRLDSLSILDVREASDQDRIRPGLALLAPGGERHMTVVRSGEHYMVRLREGEKVQSHRPSVDVLFRSVAEQVASKAVAVLLTGMGRDGAEGLMQVRLSGGRTFVQDKASSVVWGMPGAAWQMGAAEAELSLDDVPRTVIEAVVAAPACHTKHRAGGL